VSHEQDRPAIELADQVLGLALGAGADEA